MSRPKGARDLRPRKTRSDLGSKKKFYAGKPVKTKTQYKKERRGDKTQIKIWVWERRKMSDLGRLRINKYTRRFMIDKITKFRNVHLVDTSEIDTKQKIEEFMEMEYWKGEFLIMGFSKAKNQGRCKPVKLCRVFIYNEGNGNRAKMINNYRLSRYWFWKG